MELIPAQKINLTNDEAAATWFSSNEISNLKNGLRNIWKGSHINDQDFIAAVDLVQSLFSGQVELSEMPENFDKSMLNDAQMQQIEIYKECARILARHDGRGLERMYYGKSTFSKQGAKSLHVQRFVRSVLEVQDRLKDCAIDVQSDAIASQCQSLPSIWWARITAEVDAEIIRSDATPSTINVIHNRKSTGSYEV
jgi:hypothetical protein